MTFDELVRAATLCEGRSFEPYEYQRRLAAEGLPELLEVPTGSGKTLAAVLPWLYRRRFHPDPQVRAATPRWLVIALPMRVLVEQTVGSARSWLSNLGLGDEVSVHTVMGGERRRESAWRMDPVWDAVFVGTIDMLLSRALNRGYGEGRFVWPIDFGLLSAGTQWVFDEVQLLGPALPTSRQLEGLRRVLGTAAPTASMWMSATVDHEALRTVDNPSIGHVVGLSDADRSGALAARLGAPKVLRRLDLGDDPKRQLDRLAGAIVERHRAGTRTIAVVNTVDRARELAGRVRREAGEVAVVLVHSRFRPGDRARVVERAVAPVDPDGPGLIVVSTQVLEAGVDVSSALLFTEAAPWPSVVQRLGRCNRSGEVRGGAAVLWAPPAKPAPYEPKDIEAAVEQLEALEGETVTPESLAGIRVDQVPAIHPVLRRRDLLELFDTTPDLSGNDVDVARFIRSTDDTDVAVAWWDLGAGAPDEARRLPSRDERCPVPIAELRALKPALDERRAWRFDHVEARWVPCRSRDLRPGMVVVFDTSVGCYEPGSGWDPRLKAKVTPVDPGDMAGDGLAVADTDVAVADDPLSVRRRWLALTRHLDDVERELASLFDDLHLPGLDGRLRRAAIDAGRLHDLGKAHPVFQGSMRSCAANDDEWAEALVEGTPLAKSGGTRRLRHGRRYFRHELASALALLAEGATVIDAGVHADDRDLVVYLVAAHHGRIRMGFRSLPDEQPPDGVEPATPVALGIVDGEVLPEVDVPRGRVPASTMDMSHMMLGAGPEGRPSWTARALALRDRPDLGPFRLATLEALVRMADWRASAAADRYAGEVPFEEGGQR